MDLEISQVLIQIVAFLLMLWVLTKFGWKPILNLLDQRRKNIQWEFNSIHAQKEEVRKLTEEYKEKLKGIEAEARHKIQEAIQQGRKIAVEIQEEAQKNSKDILLKAKSEANQKLINARKQLRDQMVNMAMIISEKILQDKLDESTHKKLIAEFINEVELK